MFEALVLLSIFAIASSGFILGNFLNLTVIICITGISAILIASTVKILYRELKNEQLWCYEAETLVAVIFVPGFSLLNIVMWITYYLNTEQAWLGDSFKTILSYILR
ncbi:MAG TPA: hypothetical protein VJB70_00085 [Candidatus Paceibacterota bacterium]